MKRFLPILAIPLIVGLVALANCLAMFAQGTHLPDGSTALTVDDSYIHLQYAWQAAHGHFFQYNPDDAPTTGETSLLYMLLLAGGFALGITRQAMPGVTVVLGGVLLAVTAAFLADLTRRLAEITPSVGAQHGMPLPTISAWGVGLLVGVLFAGSGWMAWAALSGMETSLLLLLVVGSLWALAAHRTLLAVVLAALAALTRPEALILGLVVAAALWLAPDLAGARRRWASLVWMLIPLSAAAISLAANYVATGSIGSSGLQAKSLFTLVPFNPSQVLNMIAGIAFETGVRLYSGPTPDGLWHTFPLTLALAAMGLILLWKQQAVTARRLALACLGWALLGLVASFTLQTPGWHNYRYQMPFYPALVLPGGLALAWLMDKIAGWLGRYGPFITRGGLALVVALWTGYSTTSFWPTYALDTGTVARIHIPLANWLRENTPPDTLVAVHDAGVIAFVSERRIFDLIGLTTPGMAAIHRNGPGSTYEALERARPAYYVLDPDTGLPFVTFSESEGLRGEELFVASVGAGRRITPVTQRIIITKPDWSDAGKADDPQQPDILARLDGWQQADRLDIADMADEMAHNYQWWNIGFPDGLPTEVHRMHYRADPAISLVDAGRLMTGGQSFSLQTHPGQPLMLVARLHQTADMILRVRVDGTDAGQWRLPAIPGEWLESTFLIPPNLVTAEHTRFALIIEEMFNPRPQTRYSPFYVWAYQRPDAPSPPSAPQTLLQATFGEAARLIGFDLPAMTFAPGDVIPVTLHWQAITPPHADLRVFVHLTDPANADQAQGVVAQADSAPHQGTYPFWVWQGDGQVSDTLSLAIPADVPEGKYLLLIGLYDAASGQRLPITGAEDFNSNRLLLTMITIR